MIVIGIDPHKSTHTATAVDPASNADLGSIRITSSLEAYTRLLDWAAQWPKRRWAVENAAGLGHHLAQYLVRRGEHVVDVPSTATARVRQLSRGNRRKNDRIDGAAAACVAALQGDARTVLTEDHTDVMRLLDERRQSLVEQSIRTRNQLHAIMRELIPGGVDKRIDTEEVSILLRRINAVSTADSMRVKLGLEMIGDLRRLQFQILDVTERTEAARKECGTSITNICGVGPVMAGRILGRTGNPNRFPTAAAYASYTGTAPVEIASADMQRHRLSRGGDRILNSAIHVVAVCQARVADSDGHTYYRRKLSEGKSPREAMRCLKRQIATRLWRIMLNDTKQPKMIVPRTAA